MESFSLISEKYEKLIEELVGNATLLDHSVSPCLESFIPDDVTVRNLLVYRISKNDGFILFRAINL